MASSEDTASDVIIASGGYDQQIRFWDTLDGSSYRSITHLPSQPNVIRVTPDKSYLAVGSNPQVALYDVLAGGKNIPVTTFEGHAENVTSLGFQSSLRWMYSASEDKSLRLWDLRTTKTRVQMNHGGMIHAAKLCSNEVELVTGGHDGTLKLWDLRMCRTLQELGHKDEIKVPVRSLDINEKMNKIAVCNSKGICTIYNYSSAYGFARHPQSEDVLSHASIFEAIELAKFDKPHGDDGFPQKDHDNKAPVEKLPDVLITDKEDDEHGNESFDEEYDDDDNGEEIEITIEGDAESFDEEQGDASVSPKRYSDTGLGSAHSLKNSVRRQVVPEFENGPSNAQIELAAQTQPLTSYVHKLMRESQYICDPASNLNTALMNPKQLDKKAARPSIATSIDLLYSNTLHPSLHSDYRGYSANGSRLELQDPTSPVSARLNGLNKQDSGSARSSKKWITSPFLTKPHNGEMLTKAVYSSDGNLLAICSSDATFSVWNTNDNSLLMHFIGHEKWVWDCVFSLDSHYILSGSSDKNVLLWEVRSGKRIRHFTGHTKGVSTVCLYDKM